MKKKLLFICLDHYPYEGACGKLLNNLFNSGLSESFDIHLLSYKYTVNDSEDEVIDNIHIHRFMSWFMFPKENLKELLKDSKHINLYNVFVKKIVPKVISKTNPNFYLSKQLVNDINNNIALLNNIYGFDAIIPIAAPYESVAGAVKYKKENASIKLITYQMDPCADNMIEKPQTYNERLHLENEFVQYSSAIITTPIIYKRLAEIYKEEANKIVPIEFPGIKKTVQDYRYDDSKVICLFAGSIYKGIRDPEYTVQLFENLENIEFHIVGFSDHMISSTAKNVFVHGKVDIKEADALISKANILVNIGNQMTNQVPSKLFDYISTGKPIVNIYKNENCPTLSYLARYPLSCSIMEKQEICKTDIDILQDFIMRYSNTTISNEDILKEFSDCTPEYVAKTITGIINRTLVEI